jgi:hypothetical protein
MLHGKLRVRFYSYAPLVTFHIGTFDTVSEAEHYFEVAKGDFDVAMNEPVYCTITRATSWSNSGFIEGLD